MLVETYEVTETNPDTGLAEFAPETLALIESLGLEGQKELTRTRSVEGGEQVTTIMPYREMTAEENRVYGYLLPTKMPLEKYNRGPVPLRVLQVAALASREGWFDRLEVWCPANAQDKDPLLVGKIGTRDHLLARWGDVLAPFEELRVTACEKWIRAARAKLAERTATVESAAEQYFSGSWIYGYE